MLSLILSVLWYVTIVIVLLAMVGMALLLYVNDFPRRRRYCTSSVKLLGKTVLVTGGSSGIGLETAMDFAKRGARVILACRNLPKAELVRSKIIDASGNNEVVVMECDLADLESVQKFCMEFLSKEKYLHILVNNAGIGNEDKLTKQKFDGTVGPNYVGPFLLTYLLLNKMKHSGPGRIVNVSSCANYGCSEIDLKEEDKNGMKLPGFRKYNISKLLSIIHVKELTRRLEGTGVTTYAVHPGFIFSGLFTNIKDMSPIVYYLFWLFRPLSLTPVQGAQTSIYCALEETIASSSGKYYENCREVQPNRLALDIDFTRRVWDVTKKAISEYIAK